MNLIFVESEKELAFGGRCPTSFFFFKTRLGLQKINIGSVF
jgi:hypothetical protein